MNILHPKKFFSLLFIFFIVLLNLDIQLQAQSRKIAYLTFDDGPSKNTEKILDILDEFDVKATFFVIGNNINQRNYPTLKRMVIKNNYIGLHSMSHDFKRLFGRSNSLQYFIDEMLEEQELIYKITGIKSFLLRFPYSNRELLSDKYLSAILDLNFKIWDWNVDTEDWKAKSVEEIMNKVKKDIRNTNFKDILIILFHEKDITVESLPYVINYLKSEGYEFEAYNPIQHVSYNFRGIPNI